jgi:hypothetical protein
MTPKRLLRFRESNGITAMVVDGKVLAEEDITLIYDIRGKLNITFEQNVRTDNPEGATWQVDVQAGE